MLNIAGSRENFAHELIIRFVVGEAVANPGMKGKRAMFVRWLAPLVSQQRRPFIRKVVGVIGTGKKQVNPLGPLVGSGAGEELLRLRKRRQAARYVDTGTAEKGGIITEIRRRHADGLEFLEDKLVDQVLCFRKLCYGRAERHC